MKTKAERSSKEVIATRVSWVGIIGNLLLTGFKMVAGLVAHSGAMVSDSVHSASDVLSTLIVLVSVKLSNKAADDEHPYGHERIECVAALILAFILCVIGFGIGYNGVMKILSTEPIVIPGALALVAAGISVVTKEGMYWYTIRAARKIESSALRASAWDHRSDAFSSVGSFLGILGSRIGFPKLDAVASVIICLFILKVSFDIFMDAVNKMIDRSCSEEFVEQVKCAISEDADVVNIDDIKTRMFGDRVYVDVEIAVDGDKNLSEAHQVAKRKHDMIEECFPQVKHCMVHVNPAKVSDEKPCK